MVNVVVTFLKDKNGDDLKTLSPSPWNPLPFPPTNWVEGLPSYFGHGIGPWTTPTDPLYGPPQNNIHVEIKINKIK